ncbi:hypothetical protein E5288_WYG008968 [Bos mutus]|uniref:Uncharacterized protein n=1 Tax=Bos mutus TaxID=72004 RepID=A0A6B0QV86_9CETA|nr:hypothetical protein [Bos mutus]
MALEDDFKENSQWEAGHSSACKDIKADCNTCVEIEDRKNCKSTLLSSAKREDRRFVQFDSCIIMLFDVK